VPAEEKKMGKFVRTTFGYKTSADIELDLKEGDVLKVLKEDDSGWWQARLTVVLDGSHSAAQKSLKNL
jgi:hypothetical protein